MAFVDSRQLIESKEVSEDSGLSGQCLQVRFVPCSYESIRSVVMIQVSKARLLEPMLTGACFVAGSGDVNLHLQSCFVPRGRLPPAPQGGCLSKNPQEKPGTCLSVTDAEAFAAPWLRFGECVPA